MRRSNRSNLEDRYRRLSQEIAAFKERQIANSKILPYYYPDQLQKTVSVDSSGFCVTTFTFTANNQLNPMCELQVESNNPSTSYIGVQTRPSGKTGNSVTFTVKTFKGTGSVTFTANAVATDSGVLS